MNKVMCAVLSGVSFLTLATAAQAQEGTGSGPAAESSSSDGQIVVTARRREESVQEVPVVVDTVSAEDIAELNFQNFEEIEALVPGLTFDDQGFGGGASIRGVEFDISVSGNNPTVEFYINDTPATATVVLQQIFDIEQIEVLRGPQGTLRGRASPSGAIAVRTRRPDLNEFGGNASTSYNEFGTFNINVGAGGPIIPGVLALRMAGLYAESDGNRVTSIVTGEQSSTEAVSGRVSLLFTPTDWLSLEGMYQRQETESANFTLVESANILDPTLPDSPTMITAEERLSIQASPSTARQTFDTFTWRAEMALLGQSLIYLGNYREQTYFSQGNSDAANFFPDFDFGQLTDSVDTSSAHEIRLQNEDRVAGLFDYVVGAFFQSNEPLTDLISPTVISFTGPGGPFQVLETPIERNAKSDEFSVFGSVTVHPTDNLEFTGGLRYLEIEGFGNLVISGNEVVNDAYDENKVIYSASGSYFFNDDDAMVYASVGTSYRPGPTVIGDFSIRRSALQDSFTTLQPESSTTYEVGLKTLWMDDRLRFNIAGYYQDFENYPYRGDPVFYQDFSFNRRTGQIDPGVGSFDFIAGVPVTVRGVEGELAYEFTPDWDLSLNASYSLSKFSNALVPCDDLNGDNQPDFLQTAPTLAEVQAAYGSDYLGSCMLSQRASPLAPFSASVRTSYAHDFSPGLQGFVRGLFSFTGASQGDPQDASDDQGSFGIFDLFGGLRDPDGNWEVMAYAKNLFDEVNVFRGDNLLSTSFRTPGSQTATSLYRGVGISTGREFGINLRFAFGSR